MPQRWNKFLTAFTGRGLSASVSRLAFKPSLLRQFCSTHYTSELTVPVRLIDGKLTLVPDGPRGVIGEPSVDSTEKVVYLSACHLSQPGRIIADDLRNRMRLGSEDMPTVAEAYLEKLGQKRANIEVTLEYHLLGAIRGLVLDAKGSVLYDLYEQFGQEKAEDITFTFPTSETGKNTVLAKFQEIKKSISNSVGGNAIPAVGAVVGDTFWNELITNPMVQTAYSAWSAVHEATFGNNDFLGKPFPYGGILWQNYGHVVGGKTFVEPEEALLFPMVDDGSGLQQWFAPSDYIADVGDMGASFYVHQWPHQSGKSLEFEVQSNPVTFFGRPEALRTIKLG